MYPQLIQPIMEVLQIEMSDNIILLDIEGIVPRWNTYTFNLHMKHPGENVHLDLLSQTLLTGL